MTISPTPSLFTLGAVAALTLASGITPAAAQEARAVWSAVHENDYFAGTDQNYTSGVRFARFIEVEPGGFQFGIAERLFGARGDRDEVIYGLGLGQSLYTPTDTDAEAPLFDQRPYAAWLYSEYSLIRLGGGTADQLTVEFGTVGPDALGEEVQNNYHTLIGGEEAEGWDNQIRNELGVVVSYERKLRAQFSREIGNVGVGVDVTPYAGGSVGNIRSDVRAGAILRLGAGLDDDFGPPRINPASAGVGYFSPTQSNALYAYIGGQGRYVFNDITLEGSLFDDDDPVTVDIEETVGEIQGGIVWRIADWQLAYSQVWRTKQFEAQADNQRFGAVSIARRF
ncbi:hypothetical protein PB2503_05302 [Parvularcula bermudensis HTCC2503]|uniref:Outer membrane protein n=1 Tax=Parvularcula bermudensis (strain ATCC BAA-594 / HTCC2503 / KCTC 12087) TaxID=314260 RepID=E0TG91_PARBH|nr:lipid A deacylase LpxR family protein [Parvularcula bermudensis]ADM09134.1 hypothetical protein PB2503_05302 [Parvularcula bermudensis HTCC2503]